jgi:hypothetical protein
MIFDMRVVSSVVDGRVRVDLYSLGAGNYLILSYEGCDLDDLPNQGIQILGIDLL